MFIRYRTKAIFLKKLKRFEADEHLIVYSKDFGKIGITGKSIRKIKSKLRSSAELFCYSDIEFIRGRYYNILADSDLIDGFFKTKKDIGKLSTAFKVSKLLDSFLAEEEKDEVLWNFIKKSFYLLDDLPLDDSSKKKKNKLLSFYYYFAFKLFEILGYKPEMEKCVIDKADNSLHFSPKEGGLVCLNCLKEIRDPLEIKIEKEDKIFLKSILENDFETFMNQDLKFFKMGELLKNYISLIPSRFS